MFSFFDKIFAAVTSAIISVVVSLGLVSAPVPSRQAQEVIEVNENDFRNKEKPSQQLEALEKTRLEAEGVKWEAKLEAEAAKAKAETERLIKEERVRKAAEKQGNLELQQQQLLEEQANLNYTRQQEAQRALEEQRQLELRQQKLLEEQTRQLELQRQQEAQKALEEQRQIEQARISQINNQIQALLSEYDEKIAAIDRKVLGVEQKYYEDVKKVRSQPIPMVFIDGQIQKLAREADFEINQLQLEKEGLRLEYQGRIRELKNSSNIL
jgi:hypothetical protein